MHGWAEKLEAKEAVSYYLFLSYFIVMVLSSSALF